MNVRPATKSDISAIVRLLADDPLGTGRERFDDPLPQAYYDAFDAITTQAGNQVLVAVESEGVVGCLQLTFIPGLTRCGMTRAQIEGVRVDKTRRGRNIGEALFHFAIDLVVSA